MIAELVMAAAAAASAPTSDVIRIDDSCRLVRKVAAPVKRKAARKPAPAASAASAPASALPLFKPRPKAKKMMGLFAVPADYELLCDETETTPIYYTPIPGVPFAELASPEPVGWPNLYVVPTAGQPPLDLTVTPLTFEEETPPPAVYVPRTIGGPCCYVGPPGQAGVAPEPEIWALLIAGIGAILFIRRRRS